MVSFSSISSAMACLDASSFFICVLDKCKSRKTPFLHPVLVSLSLIIVVLQLTETDYATICRVGSIFTYY